MEFFDDDAINDVGDNYDDGDVDCGRSYNNEDHNDSNVDENS